MARNPPRGETQGPGFFFHFFDFFDFVRFLAFSKKIKKIKKMKKNEKNPGCSCREGLGLQPGLRAGRTQERPESLPPRGDPGSRIFF